MNPTPQGPSGCASRRREKVVGMDELPARYNKLGWWIISLAVVALGTAAGVAYFHAPPPVPAPDPDSPARTYGPTFQIQYFCSRCHAYPRAEILPRAAWKADRKSVV